VERNNGLVPAPRLAIRFLLRLLTSLATFLATFLATLLAGLHSDNAMVSRSPSSSFYLLPHMAIEDIRRYAASAIGH
jgi:hypothetical protein